MGNVTITQVLNQVVTTLRSNLTDPISGRAARGHNWIFRDFPRYEPECPYIKVSSISSQLKPMAIGSSDWRQDVRIQITIVVDEGFTIDYDSDGTDEDADELSGYLGNLVLAQLKTQSNFTSVVWNIVPYNEEALHRGGKIYRIIEAKAIASR